MLRSYSNDPRTNESLKHSVRDGVSYAVMTGAGETYFSAYALFLKASTAQIALLAAVPPLLGSFAQLLSAWLARLSGNRRRIILTGAFMQALMWYPIIWLPYFFPEHAVPLFIGCVVLYHAWISLASPLWSSLMGDLVPERRRGRFFARRTRLMSVTTFISLLCAGTVLHFFELQEETRVGFMLTFSVAALARLISVYQLARMYEPKLLHKPMDLPALANLWPRLRASHFARFSIFFALMNFAVAIASPFFTVYMLRDLQFSYLQFTISTATSVMMQFLTLNMWGRLADIFGNRLILRVTGSVIPFLPALWLVSSEFWYILCVQVLGGLSWAGFSLSAGNFMYDVVKPEKRSLYSAYHNILSSTGIFCGALLGGLAATVIPEKLTLFDHSWQWASGLWGVLLISTFMRGLMAVTFIPLLREVRDVRPLSASGLVFRVIRFNALAGLVFDVMTLRHLRPRGRPKLKKSP